MAIKFERIEPGMTLYDVHKTKMGNTTMSQLGVWRVRVVEVDTEKRRALASWNGNRPRWFSEHVICRFRLSPPEWIRRTMPFSQKRFYCPTCYADSDEKDKAAHRDSCDHPRVLSWRKKRKKAE